VTILEVGEYSEPSGVFPIPASFSSAGLALLPHKDARREDARPEDARPGAEFVVDADALHAMLGQDNLRIIDVRSPQQCPDGHIPGAVLLDYNRLVRKSGPIEGLLPCAREISGLLEESGIEPEHFVVAYDDGAGVDAARLLWTLDAIGHKNYALLNGGFAAWDDAELDVSDSPRNIPRSRYPVSGFGNGVVSKDEILAELDNPNACIVDTRSAAEYAGEDVRAEKSGHIPGAVHFDWSSAVDVMEDGKLRDAGILQSELGLLGITRDKNVIVYCQSNRRSTHTYLVLKWLGYENVSAYTGSWSEWGNAEETPVEI
jgi:thiosulfate/3-mercaptopyruvate sulfurtransferase